jgi:penicillin-binding protein 1A
MDEGAAASVRRSRGGAGHPARNRVCGGGPPVYSGAGASAEAAAQPRFPMLFRRRRSADDAAHDFEFEVPSVAKPAPPARRRRLRPLRILLVSLCLTLLACLSALVGFTSAVQQARPSISQFTQVKPGQVGYIYAKKRACSDIKKCEWVVIGELRSTDARDFVSGSKISEDMKHAIVAIEDRRFYQHRGVDPAGIVRAVFSKLTSGSSEGASTIDQQLIKREYLKDSAQTYTRKLREALLAPQLEKKYTKEQILTQYLNGIYYGNGAYGIEDAAQTYFGEPASKLDVADSALLAAVPKSPVQYDPYVHPAAARERRSIVIDKMVQQGYATAAQGALAKQKRLVEPKHPRRTVKVHGNEGLFVLDVERQLVRRYGEEKTFGGGLRVYTSLVLGEQTTARAALKRHLKGVGPDGALVSMDPRTSEVTSVVGDWTYPNPKGKEVPQDFSLATDARRQPGSSFKPFDLLAAGGRGVQTSSTFVSHPVTFYLGAGADPWTVHNAEHTAGGPMTLRTALALSDNTVFAQLTMTIGPDAIVRAAHAAGINSYIDSGVPAIGIGGLSYGVTPLEMAHAYGTIDNKGVRVGGSVLWHAVGSGITDPTVDPIMIERVTDPAGRVIDDNTPRSVRVFPAADALSVLQAMRGVMQGNGTGVAANLPGREVAGKTGTTEAFRDAWFIGMVPQRVTSVWVGYPKGYISMSTEFHGHAVFGGTYPAMIFKDFMTKVLRRVPAAGWPSPPYVPASGVYIDPRTWYRAPGGCRYGRSLVLSDEAVNRLKGVYRCPQGLAPLPTVVGMSRKEAVTRISGAGNYTRVVLVPATIGEKAGTVVSQDPAALTQLPPRAHVTLAVATRSAQVFVPAIEGLGASAAVARLQAVGLHSVIVRIDERGRRATVASWSVTGPGAGETLASADGTRQVPQGSTIELKVSGRIATVSLPALATFTVAQAEQTLGGLGLTLRARTDGATSDPTDVISQSSPVSGSDVLPGQIVDVLASPKR